MGFTAVAVSGRWCWWSTHRLLDGKKIQKVHSSTPAAMTLRIPLRPKQLFRGGKNSFNTKTLLAALKLAARSSDPKPAKCVAIIGTTNQKKGSH